MFHGQFENNPDTCDMDFIFFHKVNILCLYFMICHQLLSVFFLPKERLIGGLTWGRGRGEKEMRKRQSTLWDLNQYTINSCLAA